jgi:hypothetical protein
LLVTAYVCNIYAAFGDATPLVLSRAGDEGRWHGSTSTVLHALPTEEVITTFLSKKGEGRQTSPFLVLASLVLTQFLWWGGIVLEAFLLARCARGRFYREYPGFFSYIAVVLLASVLRYSVRQNPSTYALVYWYSQIVSLVAGYVVILEIYRRALKDYPGAARMAQTLLMAALVLVVSKAVFDSAGSDWSIAKTCEELERDLRAVQATVLIAILGLLAYYRIPLGRNLKGILLGFGIFVGVSVTVLTLRFSFGNRLQSVYQYLPASTYFAVLIIWCGALWSYRANPVPETKPGLERDYQSLALGTRKLLTNARTHLTRAVRS